MTEPTGSPARQSTAQAGPAADLPDVLAAFLQRSLAGGEGESAVAQTVRLYHAVRTIPYGSTGDRTPEAVVRNRVGSCSGKHVLLRDLLRGIGVPAEVVTIRTHFSDGLPVHHSMPAPLQALLSGAPVVDFHHFVRACPESTWLRLDATWHDAMQPFGVFVNRDWAGSGHTRLAAEPLEEYPAVEAVAAFKRELLDGLEASVRARRLAFFTLLTAWIAAVASPDSGP